jgi:hypothetical protein
VIADARLEDEAELLLNAHARPMDTGLHDSYRHPEGFSYNFITQMLAINKYQDLTIDIRQLRDRRAHGIAKLLALQGIVGQIVSVGKLPSDYITVMIVVDLVD